MDTMVVDLEDVAIPARLRKALNDELRRIELHAARIGGGMAPAPGSMWEGMFMQLVGIIERSRPQKLDGLRRRMGAPLSEYKQRAVFRNFAALDLKDPGALLRFDLKALHGAQLAALRTSTPRATMRPAGGARVAPRHHTKLELVLRDVWCIDETGNAFVEWIGGADEIFASVATVDETGDVGGRKPFMVDDFDEGERRTYSPAKHLYTFNLTEGGEHYPKRYSAAVSLIEHDFGDLNAWYEQAIDAVAKYVGQQLGEAAGAALGALVGELAGPIGAAIGAAVGWLIGLVKGWLEDEHLGTPPLHVVVPSDTANFAGNAPVSQPRRLVFRGDEGNYRATVQWRLS